MNILIKYEMKSDFFFFIGERVGTRLRFKNKLYLSIYPRNKAEKIKLCVYKLAGLQLFFILGKDKTPRSQRLWVLDLSTKWI